MKFQDLINEKNESAEYYSAHRKPSSAPHKIFKNFDAFKKELQKFLTPALKKQLVPKGRFTISYDPFGNSSLVTIKSKDVNQEEILNIMKTAPAFKNFEAVYGKKLKAGDFTDSYFPIGFD